jgi:hypothetical protein
MQKSDAGLARVALLVLNQLSDNTVLIFLLIAERNIYSKLDLFRIVRGYLEAFQVLFRACFLA